MIAPQPEAVLSGIPLLTAPLAEEALVRRQTLPLKPTPVTLTGDLVVLTPLDLDQDAATLHSISNGDPVQFPDRDIAAYDADTLIWRFLFAGPFADVGAMRDYLQTQVDAPDGLPFCVRERATNRPIGVANFMSNVPAHLRIELGSIWYSPIAQRTGANTDATFLMLEHAFALGYRRVEWKCNALNARSRRAAERMGFTFEGVQEAHMIVKDRPRDTAWYRILDHEWPAMKRHLRLRLGPNTDDPIPKD